MNELGKMLGQLRTAYPEGKRYPVFHALNINNAQRKEVEAK